MHFVFCAVYRTMYTRFTGQAVTLTTSHQPPPNHMIGPLPVIPGPPPPAPTPPQLFPPPPVTLTTQADCQPSTPLQPNYTFSVSDSKSKSSVETQSESKISESSLRVRYPLGSKLKSGERDVRLSKRTDMAIKLFTKSHDDTDSTPSQQTSFVADFRFSMPPSSAKSVTSAATSLVVSSVDVLLVQPLVLYLCQVTNSVRLCRHHSQAFAFQRRRLCRHQDIGNLVEMQP